MTQIAIIHFNTPELTEACIKSVRKHGGDDYKILLFDNSDSRPLKKRIKGVKRIDNTKGQVIDFEKELAKYPDKNERYGCAKGCHYGSARHSMTVQKLWELLPDGFILLESDTLVKRDIGELWRTEFAAVGQVQWKQPGNRHKIPRYLPFLLYMNVPLLTKHGARFFDPMRCWALQPGMHSRCNWYDTGAAMLEDIRKTKPYLVGLSFPLEKYIVHYRSGSWRNNNTDNHKKWLDEHSELWK